MSKAKGSLPKGFSDEQWGKMTDAEKREWAMSHVSREVGKKMNKSAEYLIKSAITKEALFNLNLMIPKPMAAAMLAGMEPQREPPVRAENELENYIEMPVFEPLASLRRKRQGHRRVRRIGG